jgi:L-ascorbate metabolism protein UlaG (beta-lactamase superfamily)
MIKIDKVFQTIGLSLQPKMNTKLFSVGLLLAASLMFAAYENLKPSADLKLYAEYFVPQNAEEKDSKNIKVTFSGVSTLLIDDGETQLLIDGFFTRPGVAKVGFGKIYSDTNIVRQYLKQLNINRLKGIFVAHSHYDHALDAAEVARLTKAILFGSSSTLNIGRGAKLTDSMMQLFEPEDEMQLGAFTVAVLPSRHSPAIKILGMDNATDPNHPDITTPLRLPAKAKDFIEGGSYDFYIKHPRGRIYIKPSANFIPGALQRYPADIIFLGVGTLGKQSADVQESYYHETVEATEAKTVIPLHWDNFTLSLDKPLQPAPMLGDNVGAAFDFLIRKCNAQQRKFRLLNGKEFIKINNEKP